MASIIREISVASSPDRAWQAIRDVGNTHRLFAGVLTDCKLEEGARIVTFANGMVVRELIVDVDDERRRIAYAAVGGRTTHHNASLQVFDAVGGASRIVWTTDFLPDGMQPAITGLVDAGCQAMQKALSRVIP
jgi:carbon monoxide dehydrogenase subunit G